MNMLVDGEWRIDAYESTDEEGAFDRQETSFRRWVVGSEGSHENADVDERFEPEAGRYHLYVSRACPWAHRAAMVRALKGLEHAVSLSLVEPVRYDQGWEFSETYPDPLHDAAYLRDVYTRADPEFTGRVTVPVLWDRKEETIVNNESEEILRMFDVAFDDLAERDVDLYPEGHRGTIDRTIDDIYDAINNGVYRAGFAGTQEAYERAVTGLFDALDHWEAVLGEQRYLVGDVLTEADLCMFATLVRFDHVYHTHFKCNRRAVHEYPNLWNYTKELYQLPGISGTVNLDHIVRHYYESHADLNPKRIVPVGPDLDFSAPHDRERLPGGPPASLRRSTTTAD